MPKIKAKATWVENVRSIVDNQRTHNVVCDLSTPAGGTDSGPTALELSMMTLADCGATIFANVCKKSNIQPSKVEVSVEADKVADSPAVTGITMKVNVVSNAIKELVEAAWRRTEANCPVLIIFKDPTPVKIEFESKTDVSLTNDGIEITAETDVEIEDKGKNFVVRERVYSHVYKQLSFPEEVIPEKAESTFRDGLLEVCIPKKTVVPAPKKHKVAVK